MFLKWRGAVSQPGSVHCRLVAVYICKINFLILRRAEVIPFFKQFFLNPQPGQGESVTKPMLKTAHYLFCRGLDLGNFTLERLFFLLTNPPRYAPNWLHKSCLV